MRFAMKPLLLCLLCCGSTVGRNAASPENRVPTTISEEAQKFLRTSPPAEAPARTFQQWLDFQREIEERETPRSFAARDKYARSVEIKQMGEVDVHIVTPKDLDANHEDKILVHIHGGGFYGYSSSSTYFVTAPLANLTGLRVYCIDYRLAPKHPFPAGLEDCVSAYRNIVDQARPKKVGLVGISAGGNLILALAREAGQDDDLRSPDALAAITPATDLTGAGDSFITLDGFDPILATEGVPHVAKIYAPGGDLKDPRISPVYGNYTSSFPRTLIQTGTRDLLLSDCVRLHRKMKRGDVDVELSVWEGMWHAFQVIPDIEMPESKEAFQEIADFFRDALEVQARQ